MLGPAGSAWQLAGGLLGLTGKDWMGNAGAGSGLARRGSMAGGCVAGAG